MTTLSNLESQLRAKQFIKLHPQYDKNVPNSRQSQEFCDRKSTYRDSYSNMGILRSMSQYGAVAEWVVDSCLPSRCLEYPPIRNSDGQVSFSVSRQFANSSDLGDGKPRRMSERHDSPPPPCVLTDLGNEHYRCDLSNFHQASRTKPKEFYDVRRKFLQMKNPGYAWEVPNMSTGQPKRYTNFLIN